MAKHAELPALISATADIRSAFKQRFDERT